MSLIWIILIATMVASFIVQQTLNSRFKKYEKVALPSGLSGAEVARRMLADHGINSVQVVRGSGFLTDHFDPSARVIKLSPEVYDGRSIAAAAVAAHECGHAVQHSRGYMPLKLRSALVPVVNFANSAVTWLLLLGVLAIQWSGSAAILWAGILLFALTTLFSIITLPVELNASSRAVAWLGNSGLADSWTMPKAKDALKWAAYTYVIAAIGSIATLLYYVAIAMGGRRD